MVLSIVHVVVALISIITDVKSISVAPLNESAPADVDQVAAAADVKVNAPADVDQVEAPPAVNVIAPDGVILQDVMPVSLTAPSPSKSNVAVSSPYLLAPVPFIVTVAPSSVTAPLAFKSNIAVSILNSVAEFKSTVGAVISRVVPAFISKCPFAEA